MLTRPLPFSISSLAAVAMTVAGCGIFGPGGPSVATKIIDFGPLEDNRPDSLTIQVRPGTVILERTVSYNQPNYGVEGMAAVEAGLLKVDVETRSVADAYILAYWFKRYRLTVSDVKPGAYRLRLLWRNRLYPPGLQFQDVADTLITVP